MRVSRERQDEVDNARDLKATLVQRAFAFRSWREELERELSPATEARIAPDWPFF